MKGKTIIIVSIIINILLLGAVCNFIKKEYLNNKSLILKTMSEREYEDNIKSLNKSHEDYVNHIKASKIKIASAITDMGVETLETANVDTMASNIKSILTNKDAASISYDNGNSSLTSTNLQGAVDEIDNNVNDLNNNLNKIIIKKSHYTEKQTLPTGNSTINVTAPTVEGYTPLALVAAQSNSTNDIWVTHDTNSCRVYNNSGSQRENFYLSVVWLYIKNEFNQ